MNCWIMPKTKKIPPGSSGSERNGQSMAAQERFCTVEEFEAVAPRPENRVRRIEYVGRKIIEVVSNIYTSKIAAKILIEFGIYLKGKNLGDITGADGGCVVSGERYKPHPA